MDPSRLRLWLAAPMASLFLVLSLCAFVVQRPYSSGILVPMMRERTAPVYWCDFHGFTIRMLPDGQVLAVDTEIPPDRLVPLIAEVMEYRSDRTVYVIADQGVSYGRVAGLLDKISHADPKIQIALVARQAQVEMTFARANYPHGLRLADNCRFEWPRRGTGVDTSALRP